jgi:hypothetical protein
MHNEWVGHVAHMLEGSGVYRVLVGKPKRRWEDIIRMDLWEVGYACFEWMDLVQDGDRWCALVSAVMNLWVP